jgi:hypothetical protein
MGNICNQKPEAKAHKVDAEKRKNSKGSAKEKKKSEYQRFHDYIIVVFCSDGSEVFVSSGQGSQKLSFR